MKFWPFKTRPPSLPPCGARPPVDMPDAECLSSDSSRLAPSGLNYDVSREAFDLFAALHAGNTHDAMFRAFRLQRLARDAKFPDTQEAAESLEIALMCCEACGASPVPLAAARLVRTMVLDGLIHAIAIQQLDAAEHVRVESSISHVLAGLAGNHP